MTPEERNLVIELFDRLATLEDAQRDPEAERLIRDGLRQAPNALYALVQTVLVQDEALKRADARIRELESASAAEAAPRDQSFLGGVRESVFGKREGRGSVPSVRPDEAAPMSPAWHTSGAGRLVSRHRRRGRRRRDRRLAAAQRHSFHDGLPTGGACGVRSGVRRERIIPLGWRGRRRRTLPSGRPRRRWTGVVVRRRHRQPRLWPARRRPQRGYARRSRCG